MSDVLIDLRKPEHWRQWEHALCCTISLPVRFTAEDLAVELHSRLPNLFRMRRYALPDTHQAMMMLYGPRSLTGYGLVTKTKFGFELTSLGWQIRAELMAMVTKKVPEPRRAHCVSQGIGGRRVFAS